MTVPSNEGSGYGIKPADGLAPALELWGMWSILSLFLDPLWSRVVALDRVQSMGQIQLFDHLHCVSTNDFHWTELLEIKLLDHLAVYKQMTDV